MKKILLFLLLLFFVVPVQKAEAKIWTKELISKVDLDSGYKLSLCTIDLKYDSSSIGSNIFSVPEKDFEANPQNYPCNKQSREDVLFANITLTFTQANGGIKEADKLIEFQNKLYSIQRYGGEENEGYPNAAKYNDLAAFDWFSTLDGMHDIRGSQLYNTDPAAKGETIPDSSFLIIHDPTTGKFVSALFLLNNQVYKLDQIVSQVTQPTTLVDYSVATTGQPVVSEPPVTEVPSISAPPVGNLQTWSTVNNKFGYSIKYPTIFTPVESVATADNGYLSEEFTEKTYGYDIKILTYPSTGAKMDLSDTDPITVAGQTTGKGISGSEIEVGPVKTGGYSIVFRLLAEPKQGILPAYSDYFTTMLGSFTLSQ